MKEIKITKGHSAIVDDCDFERVSRYKWFYMKGYAVRNRLNEKGQRRLQYLARFVMEEPNGKVDHRSMNKLDNRRNNLRIATVSQNGCNRGKPCSNTSGFKGVSWDATRGKWSVKIAVNGNTFNLGRFIDLQEAASAYKNAAPNFHGEFCRTE